MTNADKYLKDGVSVEEFFKFWNNFIDYIHENCIDFNIDNFKTFLCKQVKPTLTEDEKVILRQLNKWFIVIGKTEYGCIMVQDKCQGNEKHFGVTFDLLFAELFEWIQNGEEYSIKELLGDE